MALVELGFISRPHGFKGDCVVVTDSGRESVLKSISVVWVGTSPENSVQRRLLSSAWMPKGWKVKLEGVDSDSDVKALRGYRLFVQREDLPETSPNEFYLSDLTDAEVWDAETKERIGTFRGLESDGKNHEWWIVETATGNFLVPPWRRFVEKVDVKAKQIWLRDWRELLA